MARKRRYDTGALVFRFRKQRFMQQIVGCVGATVFLVPLAIYGSGVLSPPASVAPVKPRAPETHAEEPPSDVPADPPTANAPADPAPGPPSSEKSAAAQPAQAASKGRIRVSLSRRGRLWVNGQNMGKVKNRKLSLAPGVYMVKADFGRRSVRHQAEVKANERVALFFHAGKKRVFVKKR